MITKKNIRFALLSLITGFLYVIVSYSLFVQANLLTSLLYLLIFFIVFHLFFIEIYTYKFRYFFLSVLFLLVLVSVFWWQNNLNIILSILALHTWIILLGYYLKDELHNTISFSSFSYFLCGWYIFTVCVTLAYGIALIGFYKTFPFTCAWLSASSNQVVDTVSQPFTLWLEEVKKIKNQTRLFFWARVKDVVQLDQQLHAVQDPGPLGRISKELVHQIQNENVSTSMGICDYLLSKVHTQFWKSEFTASLILLLFLMLYPFVRIVVAVMSILAFIIFKLCYLIGIYEVSSSPEEIEKIG